MDSGYRNAQGRLSADFAAVAATTRTRGPTRRCCAG
jgi:hypothetical protein